MFGAYQIYNGNYSYGRKMYIKDTSRTAISTAELITELTPAVKESLKTAGKYILAPVCSFFKISTLHSCSYFTIPHCEKGHYFNSILKGSTTSQSFKYPPQGHREDVDTSALSKNSVILGPQDFCWQLWSLHITKQHTSGVAVPDFKNRVGYWSPLIWNPSQTILWDRHHPDSKTWQRLSKKRKLQANIHDEHRCKYLQ